MKKLLLIVIVSILIAIMSLTLAVPVFAAENGAAINKITVDNGDGTLTSTISVKNNNDTATITITSITDAVYHKGGLPNPELSGELLPGGNPVTINAGETYQTTFTFTIREMERGYTVQDVCTVTGINNANDPPINQFTLSYPHQFPIPLPELSTGFLFGSGILILGGLVWLNRRKFLIKA